MSKLASKQLNTTARQTFSNVNVTALPATNFLAQTGALSAPVVVTLPSANAVLAGQILTIVDESATCSATNTIAIIRAGSDTIDGTSAPCILNTATQSISLASDGSSKWSVVSIEPMFFDFIASNASFVIPNGYSALRIHGISAGAGGGSGRRDATLVQKSGGGGGSSGGYATIDYSIADIGGPGSLNISIGAGGSGGAGQTTDATNGLGGTVGGATTIAAGSVFLMNLNSPSNGTGGGGGATAGSGGALGSTAFQQFPNLSPGSGSSTGASSGSLSGSTPGGGGGGGGSNASNAASSVGSGGGGGRSFTSVTNGGSGGIGGTNGTNGSAGTIGISLFGGGGGGGGGGTAGTGGNGGNGARGGGGGGGGASLNGNVSGAGGNGGNGFVRLIFM